MLNQESYQSLHEYLSRHLSAKELEMMISHNPVMFFQPGETILHQGKYATGIYLIISGTVLVTAKMLGEGITQLETLDHGNFIGEASFIEHIPCPTSMTAQNEVECLFLTKTYIEFLTAYYPEIKYHLYRAISAQVCARIKQVHDKIIKFMSESNMLSRPFFGDIIHSLTKPQEIHQEDISISSQEIHDMYLFQGFSSNEVTELLKHTILLKAGKNCTLIHKGEKNASNYIVIQGAVQTSIVQDNKIAKLSIIGPATLFTSISCEDLALSYTITFTTREETILLKLSDTGLDYIEKNLPTIWYKLYNLICRSLVALEKSVDKLDIRLNVETYNR